MDRMPREQRSGHATRRLGAQRAGRRFGKHAQRTALWACHPAIGTVPASISKRERMRARCRIDFIEDALDCNVPAPIQQGADTGNPSNKRPASVRRCCKSGRRGITTKQRLKRDEEIAGCHPIEREIAGASDSLY